MAFSHQINAPTYPYHMARSYLQLAALATAAVPDLEVTAASPFGFGRHGDFESALLTASNGHEYVIRIPTSERAESEQSADLVALRSLSPGLRARLPFAISSFVGQTPLAGTRAIVYEFVHGRKVGAEEIARSVALCDSIGKGIAAIHSIPTSFVADAGLPVLDSVGILRSVRDLIDSAASTRLLPKNVERRWRTAAETPTLWQFIPCTTNGALDADSYLVEGSELVGILGWQDLRVDDPAKDLHWIYALNSNQAAETILATYASAIDGAATNSSRGSESLSNRIKQLAIRARLYSELELARWLEHGIKSRSTEVVDDAVAMLQTLEGRLASESSDSLHPETVPVLTVEEVQDYLDQRSN